MSTRELGYKRVLGVQNDDTITYTVQEDQREAHLRSVSIILIVYSLQNNRINFFPNEVGLGLEVTKILKADGLACGG